MEFEHKGAGRREPTPSQASQPNQQPEQQTRPYQRRLKLEKFGPGRDLAPYTPEEEAEIRRGVSEWEIQSRRTRNHSTSLNVEAKQASQKRSYRKHRAKRLEYQRTYRQEHKAEIQAYDSRRFKKHKPFRQVLAEVQGQQNRSPQPPPEPSEAGLSHKGRLTKRKKSYAKEFSVSG